MDAQIRKMKSAGKLSFMRRLSVPRGAVRSILLALFCLLNAGRTNAQEAPPPPSTIAPSAKQVIDRAVEAMGGAAFLNSKNLRTAGRFFAIGEDDRTAGFAPFESTVEFPDKRRFTYGKGTTVTLINDGERGWQLDRYGMIRQPPEQVRRWRVLNRYSLENLLRVLVNETGLLIQDAGVDFVDNLPARKIEIFDSNSTRIVLYVHRDGFLPIRISYHILDPKTREWEEYADVYGDYREVQGIQTPMQMTRFLNGARISQVFRTSVQYNVEYGPDFFTPGG
jgi:hypothetical protein